jgi:hypothetical protein
MSRLCSLGTPWLEWQPSRPEGEPAAVHRPMRSCERMIASSSRTLTRYILVLLVTLVTAGCDVGGVSSTNQTPPPPSPSTGFNVVANAGPIVAVRVGEMAVLDGSRSSAGYQRASEFSWTFTYKPDASNAELQYATTATPSFVADTRGVYMVQVEVSDSEVTSPRQVGLVVATVAPEGLTGHANHMGLSSTCVSCHSGDVDLVPGVSKILGKSGNHLATGNTCQACHTPQAFELVPFVDHQDVLGDCSECHNGTLAVGMSPLHTPTDVECDACHDTTHFLELAPDGGFDHSDVSRSCTGCHNGVVAIGRHEGHVVTEAECGSCHTTMDFLPAYPDHSDPDVVAGRCDSCHGVGQVPGQPIGHPVASVDCGVCHNVSTFSLGGVFDHSIIDSVAQPCAACHNDDNSINATGMPLAHVATDSDCGSCHDVGSFVGAFVDHEGIVDDCASCHGVTASGKPSNHMPTLEDCSACHTAGTFISGTYDHAGVVNDCARCHDNVISVGKLVSHLPTNPIDQDCADCHTTTEFANAAFDHVSIDPGNCVLCHDGEISIGKSTDHVPTTLDCSSCHGNDTTSFAGITFNHLGIDQNDCAACHDNGIATPKAVSHIPTQDDCSACHDSDTAFASTTFLNTVHQDVTRACEGCHVARFHPDDPTLYKAPNHLPTTQDCYLCHVKAAFAPAITPLPHTGITGNCASCHDGSVDHIEAGAAGSIDTAIHRGTSSDCSACHDTTSFAGAHIDHSGSDVVGRRCDSCHDGVDAIGKDAKVDPPHLVTSQDCGVCHVSGGTFATAVFDHTGIVSNCATCHDGVGAAGMSVGHVPIGPEQDCSACHSTIAFSGASFDHADIVGDCSSCHDGTTARGKTPPVNHVPTNGDCVECHQTTGFIPATFSHAGIMENCVSCHGAGFAEGKSDGHVQTNEDCGVCHNTDTFVGAAFDHTGIVDGCASCHGVSAIGKHDTHIATSLDCHLCHTTATFVGGTWTHEESAAGRCDQCHNDTGGGAAAKPADHMSTSVQCDECHATNGWAPTIFSHDQQGDYPGDHRRDPGCTGCHGGSVETTFAWPSPQYAPFCAACHERDFKSKGKHIGGEGGTVEQNKDCSTSGCHQISSSEF